MSITRSSETTELQADNRPACETWAQILVGSLFFEFLGLAQITTSNLGASSSGEFPGLTEMGVFPSKQDFKGRELGRKVTLSANMYSFSNIYSHPPPFLQSISLAWIKSLTFWPRRIPLLGFIWFDFFFFKKTSSKKLDGEKKLEMVGGTIVWVLQTRDANDINS